MISIPFNLLVFITMIITVQLKLMKKLSITNYDMQHTIKNRIENIKCSLKY